MLRAAHPRRVRLHKRHHRAGIQRPPPPPTRPRSSRESAAGRSHTGPEPAPSGAPRPRHSPAPRGTRRPQRPPSRPPPQQHAIKWQHARRSPDHWFRAFDSSEPKPENGVPRYRLANPPTDVWEPEIRGFAITRAALFALADWLRHCRVTRVVMESTGDLLEGPRSGCWRRPGWSAGLVNARDVKNVPGRPKTDKHDAVWLAKVAERGMCRPVAGAAPPDSGTAGSDPVPPLAHSRAHPRDAASGEAAPRRPDQAVQRDQRHLRSVRARDARRADRRAARPEGARPDGPGPDARQDHGAAGGAVRVLHRSPRLDSADDAGQHRPAQQPDRGPRRQDRAGDRPVRRAGQPAR